jgi:tetratricopeptide (TPR) repeat protein
VAQNDLMMGKQLERDAVTYPDERAEILMDAAAAWHRAGRPERAVELLTEIVGLGGEDGCGARFELANLYFETGDADAMNAELAVLARDPDLNDGHCEMAAELLAEHGDLVGSARWYNRAVARLAPEQIDDLKSPAAQRNPVVTHLVYRRRQVRQQLGLPLDMLDELVSAPSPVERTQFLTFQRAELAEARRRWPTVFTETDDEYCARAERTWHGYREAGVAPVALVLARAEDLAAYADRVGGSAEDAEVRARYAAAADPATTFSWPPARNALCWCGANRKYKKCCGGPHPA